ncbi:hypothetical protein [Bacillus sp. X1(2014)]|uniref:hypothetical protein n=1 Tax=Bacillus sp. X1(2014) TaxID=1565991 RepID=UPI00119D456D|nr:hypothetical protein [Bacillus sp. X1(2014)]
MKLDGYFYGHTFFIIILFILEVHFSGDGMAAPSYIHMVMVMDTLIMGMGMDILTISKCLLKIQVLVLQPGFLEDPASKLVFETEFLSDDTLFYKNLAFNF